MSAPMYQQRPSHIGSAETWRLRVDITTPLDPPVGERPGPGALVVPASKHERDGYGLTLLAALTARGFTVLATDVRGRGDSCEPCALHAFPPGQLRAVRTDVAVALDELARQPGVDPERLVVFTEQDTADPAAAAALTDERVIGVVLISARLSPETLDLVPGHRAAVCGLTAKEDLLALEAVTEAFCRASHPRSRLRVVDGVGSGTTMFSAWQFLHRSEPPLERWLAAWCSSVVRQGS